VRSFASATRENVVADWYAAQPVLDDTEAIQNARSAPALAASSQRYAVGAPTASAR
jgi:hypothetical protein